MSESTTRVELTDAQKDEAMAKAAADAQAKAAKAAVALDGKLTRELDAGEKAIVSRVSSVLVTIRDTKKADVHLHVTPSFPTWEEYITAKLSTHELMHHLVRQPVAEMLHNEGISYPSIATALGVSLGTAWNDVNRPKTTGTANTKPVTEKLATRLGASESVAKAIKKAIGPDAPQQLSLPELRTIRADLVAAIERYQAELSDVDALIAKKSPKRRGSKADQAKADKAKADAAASNMNPRAGQRAA